MRKKPLFLTALALAATATAVSVNHERGTLNLGQPARRVVALEYSFVDTLVALGVNTLLLPLLVELFHLPVIASQLLIVVVTSLVSWFGHKHFSFRRSPRASRPSVPSR